MKKILAVATALVLTISSLCVFVVADTTTTTYTFADVTQNTSIQNWGYSDVSVSADGALTVTLTGNYSGGAIAYDLPSSIDATTITEMSFDFDSFSDYTYLAISVYVNGTAVGDVKYGSTTFNFADNGVDTSTLSSTDTVSFLIKNNCYGSDAVTRTWTVSSFTVTTEDTSSSSSRTAIYTYTAAENFVITDYSSYLTSSYAEGDTLTITATLKSDGYFNGTIGANGSDGWGSMSSSFESSDGSTISPTYTFVVGSDVYAEVQVWFVSGNSVELTSLTIDVTPAESSTTSSMRFVYVNEEYHALIVDGHFICVPHTANSDGYCTVCKEYVGGEETEATVVNIDGIDYYEAFSYDINLASNNWASAALGDSTFAAALNTEGAILRITRDTETIVSYVSGEIWDKIAISANSTNVFLATVGTTTEDEDGLVAYTSDDGTTISYDGATVYAALEDAGIAGASSYSLLTNSSASYTITSVKVLVPVGTVVTETVDVDEPAEDTNTETEDDELDVDDTDAEEVTETNPTTGAVLALVPMAIAGFAVVASKKK